MLPFMKHKEVSVNTPSESLTREPDEAAEEYDMLHAAAEDLIKAVHSKNVAAVSEALKAAFEICDSQPHYEGPHED